LKGGKLESVQVVAICDRGASLGRSHRDVAVATSETYPKSGKRFLSNRELK